MKYIYDEEKGGMVYKFIEDIDAEMFVNQKAEMWYKDTVERVGILDTEVKKLIVELANRKMEDDNELV